MSESGKAHKAEQSELTGLLCVGDTLIVDAGLVVHRYRITRVTKTLAKSMRPSDGYEYTFKREISNNMSHPYERWDTCNYSVERDDA